MAPSGADICIKLGYPRATDKGYKVWVSNFKRTWLRQQQLDLIPGPVAVAAQEKTLEWEAGIRKMYTDFPTRWGLAKFANPGDRQERARQILILQAKKVHSDI